MYVNSLIHVILGSRMYVCNQIWLFSPINLLNVDLTIRPTERTEKGRGNSLHHTVGAVSNTPHHLVTAHP